MVCAPIRENRAIAWVELFAVFVVCHLAGDFIVQTDWQATHKRDGLGHDPEGRRALLSHVATYTLCFVPAFAWICSEEDLGLAALAAFLVAVPHLIQDDWRLLRAWARRVKRLPDDAPEQLLLMVDQSFHLITLFGLALLVGGING